jgi:hypothetical protein
VVLIEKRPLNGMRAIIDESGGAVGWRATRRLGRNNWIWRLPDDVASRWRRRKVD